MKFDLDSFILNQLDAIESRPEMYASCPEALEAMYLTLLDLLARAKGIDKREELEGHGISVVRSAYLHETATGSQGCIHIWARDGQDITVSDTAKYLQRVRGRVLTA